jgi:hypothetical protein
MDSTGITHGDAGANVTWNFTVTPDNSEPAANTTYSSAEETPYFSSFPGATLAYIEEDLYVYYKTTSTTFELMGIATTGLEIVYQNTQDLFRYPSNYNHQFTDSFSSNFDIAGFASTRDGVATYQYDGYGTLIVNGITYNNVSRIKYTQDINDVYGFGFTSISQSTTYAWYFENYPAPLFSIMYTTTISNGETSESKIVTLLDNPPIGIKEANESNIGFNIFPNPVNNGKINLVLDSEEVFNYKITIFNNLGQAVLSEENIFSNSINMDVSMLPKGVYQASVISEDGKIKMAKKFVVN